MSSTVHNGGPAFPNDYVTPQCQGMSLRDWFAGQALSGLIAIDPDGGPLSLALEAYNYADAMIMAREEKPDT